MDQWTPRVGARANLAALLRYEYPDKSAAAGIKLSELDTVIDTGKAAREGDIDQKEELAIHAIERAERKEAAASVFERESTFRDRVPAVIDDLQSSEPQMAAFLATLSMARFRFRDLPVEVKKTQPRFGPEVETPEVKKVMRVEREDIASRAGSLAAFCRVLCKPGHEPIVAELTERGLSRQWLTKLAEDADAVEKAGKNSPKAAAATAREAEAVAAQKATWTRIRRMVRTAVKGTPVLEAKFAEC